MHGLFNNALSWMITGSEEGKGKALPYQVVDTGLYDVWLMNWRGLKVSRYHTWMSPDTDERFWAYSFEEFGGFDLKAVIEFIKKEKNSKDKISLVGYSEGTTSSFFATAEEPDYYE